MGREFTRWDKVIYVATYAWTASWVVVFVVGTVLNLTREVCDRGLARLLADLHDDLSWPSRSSSSSGSRSAASST
ncbi:MAG: hypothetical protein MZU95_01405 [Desulfomicrobium escambiense]|nr:hypothetical protein [Desulfomicrobium escambiense]